jgi:hypothetical protein
LGVLTKIERDQHETSKGAELPVETFTYLRSGHQTLLECARGLMHLVHISKPTKNFSVLVPACTSLYKLAQAQKVLKVKSVKARSKILQVKSEIYVEAKEC